MLFCNHVTFQFIMQEKQRHDFVVNANIVEFMSIFDETGNQYKMLVAHKVGFKHEHILTMIDRFFLDVGTIVKIFICNSYFISNSSL